jgi:hypothetical protein
VEAARVKSEKLNGWRDITTEVDQVALHDLLASGARIYIKGGNRVVVSVEDRFGDKRGLWHLSISRVDRYPGWDEILAAREQFLPHGTTFAMILPRLDEYVNLHNNCFHLWEIRDQHT